VIRAGSAHSVTAALVLLLSAAVTSSAGAQGGRAGEPQRPPAGASAPRTHEDSLRVRRDSLKALPLVQWQQADSVAFALMKRKGFQFVRYQADSVTFDAKQRTILLTGAKGARAAVEREPTLLVADTIEYGDSSSTIAARGDTITMRDPSRGDDLLLRGHMTYNLNTKEGKGTYVSGANKNGNDVWYVEAHTAAFAGDTTTRQKSAFYGKNGTITACDDTFPHYHFAAGEIKRVAGDIVVARPAVLYILDVPVMWFPFVFQDARAGRRTGMLTPRFGITELVRNSPTYRRTVENLGYYFALSDYYDLSTSLDWRSSANATDQDPGWVRLNGEVRYRWLDRFVSGRLALSRQTLSTGAQNTLMSWSHQEDFSLRSHFTMSLNYSTNTTVQRQTLLNPLAAVSTIASQLNYQREMGDFSMSIGGTQRQYPGRPQIDRDFPSLNLSSKPINLASWLVWTPTFSMSSTQSLHMDSQGDFSNSYFTRSDGTLDSTKVDRGTRTSQMTLNTPFKVFDTQVTLAVRGQDRENDFPERKTLVDPVDTSKKTVRVYQRTYLSTVDFDLNMNLPTLRIDRFNLDKFNLVPSLTLANVDPNPYFVRSERTGIYWVSQSKRPSFGLSMSPTFFGLFPGFGPVEKFRHSITPTFSYSYSPAAKVSNDYLAALGNTPVGYLGGLAQNRVTLSISQNFEAKIRQHGDSAVTNPDAARKIKVLSLTFTPLTWDFERAHHTGKSGFATDNFGYTLRSDLLPGFDFGGDYSLFQGSVLSDSAIFSPYLTSIRASFSLDAKSSIVRAVARMFGSGSEPAGPDSAVSGRPADQAGSRLAGTSSVAGQPIRTAFQPSSGRGFDAQITFSKNQQRPPVGGNVIQFDPTIQCAPLKDLNPLQYDICVSNALAAPPPNVSNTQTTAGGSFFRIPSQTNIQARTNFNLTQKWSASWSTNYDLETQAFGSQTVSLQRDLHDWRAAFGFTQAPNGNFAFTFNISLKPEPDVKFDYNRSSYHQPGVLP
jgi:hypothetical protein